MECAPSISSTDVAVCERKPTRPSIISALPRPVTNQVAALGSRKMPTPPTTQPGLCVEDVNKRNLLLELDLQLSDEECAPPPPKRAILITPLQDFEKCIHRFVKGPNKGVMCGKKTSKGRKLCAMHFGVKVKKTLSSPSVSVQDLSQNKAQECEPKDLQNVLLIKSLEETKAKVKTLEQVVLQLMKDAPKDSVASQPEPNPVKGMDLNIKKTRRPQIQKIRIYKLQPTETYRLICYKDGMAVLANKGKRLQVPLPAYMKRPIPNGKWSLVCDSEEPRMIWKEV